MATDINTTKSTLITDSALPATKTTAQGSRSGINFGDIIRKSGNRLENGLHALSDRAGITGVSERTDNAPAADDYSYDGDDTRNDNTRSRADSDDHSDRGQEHYVSSDSDYSDDYDNNGTKNYKPETAEASSEEHAGNKNHSGNTQREERSDKGGEVSTHESGDDGSVEVSNSDDGEKRTAKDDAVNNTNGSTAAGKGDGKEMLNSLLANPQASTLPSQATKQISTQHGQGTTLHGQASEQDAVLPGQASKQAQTNTQGNMGKNNTAEGLNVVTANVSTQNYGSSANAGQTGANAQNTQAQTQPHNLSNTQGQAQVQNINGAEMQAAAEAQIKVISKANEQAAQLSKMVGGGKKVDVSVTITDEKSTLVSKPTANLASNTVLAADTTAASLRSQQGKSAGNANATGQVQQLAGQAAGAAGQVQQATGAQTQFTNVTSAGAKGAAQVGLHTVAAQGTLSSNGETPVAAAPNSVSATQQAQQNTSTQAANYTRFTTANHAVAEQVSVQINKALNAGNDKISIQLKPADLGRVDVQMEVGQDGRVTAVVTADNKQTLDLLQKDSKQLQEALQQAGLQTDDDSLSFNLREQDDGQEMVGSGGSGANEDAGDELTLEEELAGVKPNIITDTRVDVRA
jgi:flagellar hook-length control protein FliK